MSDNALDETLRNEILNICNDLAFPNDIVAVSIRDSPVRYADRKTVVNVLLIVNSPKLMLKYQVRPLSEGAISLLAVDQKTLEKDVSRDWLGGLLVENMLIPYEPLVNRDFLWSQEVKSKERIVIEILGNLVLEYPEMSHELLIRPEYFMFEAMARKASLYPPITYRFLEVLRSRRRERYRKLMMDGFEAALSGVAEEGLVTFFGEYVKVTKKFIEGIQRRKLRVLNLLRGVRSTILRHSLEAFPKMMRSIVEDYWMLTKRFLDSEDAEIYLPDLEDPKKLIFVPTPLGPVSLSDKVTIEDFAKRTIPDGRYLKTDMERLGGVLNSVYRLKIWKDKEEEIITVKVFKDWYGWKWFPLALWALGTRDFAVLGKSRLEREYAINRFLQSRGVNVPRVLFASPKERLIFLEHVQGETLATTIKKLCSHKGVRADLIAVIRKVGWQIAKIHGLDVALGDCKPENVILAEDGRVFFVDLEQAERGGDQAWDIAELLYYSGHYASFSPLETAQTITAELLEGYLEAGGKPENIKRARSPRYIKVFSFFAPPHILLAISNTCKQKLKELKNEKTG